MSDAIRALVLARDALASMTCGCEQVCGDTDCRESDHPHDSGFHEGCSAPTDCRCAPACVGYAPDVCEVAAKAREALAEIEKAIAEAPAEEPVIRWSARRHDGAEIGVSRNGVVYEVVAANPQHRDLGAYFWWLDEHDRSRWPQPHYGFGATMEVVREAAEEHARSSAMAQGANTHG